MKISVAVVLCLAVVAIVAANQKQSCDDRGGQCKMVSKGDESCLGGVRKLDCPGKRRCCLPQGSLKGIKNTGKKNGKPIKRNGGDSVGRNKDHQKNQNANGGKKKGDGPKTQLEERKVMNKQQGKGPRKYGTGKKPKESGKPQKRPNGGKRPGNGNGDKFTGNGKPRKIKDGRQKLGKGVKRKGTAAGKRNPDGKTPTKKNPANGKRPNGRKGTDGVSTRQNKKCGGTKKKCRKEGGKCQAPSKSCTGKTLTGKTYCKRSCSCCVKSGTVTCKAKRKCTKKSGVCGPSTDTCDGQIVNNGCKGGSSCACCAPKTCKDKKNKCESAGGNCIFSEAECSGQVNTRLCGKFCQCCINNPNTTPEPSTTPVNDAESPTAKATTTEPTTTPPTTTEPTTTQPTTTPPTTTEPTTTPPTTTEPTTTQPTTTPPTTTEPTTTQPTTTPPTTTEPTTTPPTTTEPTTTPPTTTEPTTTPPTTTQTTTTPPPTTQTTTTPPTTTQTTTTPPTTTQTTTTTPTTSASTSASQGPAVTRLYCNDDCGQSTVTVPRIVGGEEATIHEYPWQVLLTVTAIAFPNGATCGASIIKKGWILTAAHCFVDPNTVALYPGLGLKVTVAEHDTDNASETEEIDITPTGNVLFVHPDYKQADRNSEEHDIALVYLGGTLTFGSGIKPICMPVESDYTPEKEVVVTGWGVTQWQGDQPPKLQEVALNLKSQADCETLNNNAPATYAISGNMVCALGPNKDACQGDSGGPLVTQSADGRWVQLGVVSFGYQCAVTNVPGFYTKVSNYIPWITQTTGNTDC